MSGAVLSYGNTCVRGYDLDILHGIAQGLTNLIPGSTRSENGKGAYERDLSERGQSCGSSDHILLGNADVKEAVRKSPGKLFGPGGTGKICIQHHNVWVLLS
jgi:hypothetical protein